MGLHHKTFILPLRFSLSLYTRTWMPDPKLSTLVGTRQNPTCRARLGTMLEMITRFELGSVRSIERSSICVDATPVLYEYVCDNIYKIHE